MSWIRRSTLGALALVSLYTACRNSNEPVTARQFEVDELMPDHTMGTGTLSVPLGRSTFSDPKDQNFKIKRITGDWSVEIKANPAFDISAQSILFNPGGQSGWHRHPGPVFIQVVEGTMTFYESDDPTCTPIVRTKGQGYLDKGEHAHIARNETQLPAENLVTYFAPPGVPLRIDAPAPGNCPF